MSCYATIVKKIACSESLTGFLSAEIEWRLMALRMALPLDWPNACWQFRSIGGDRRNRNG
jgi:hypothetical protein